MNTRPKPSFFTLLLLFSFAAVNAVLFTPALPAISHYFEVSGDLAQDSMALFLLGYTFGQLIYGPIANRYGRIPAIYIGAVIQIISSFGCVLAVHWHSFELFNAARFMAAIGSAVGLKITFTLVNEYYSAKEASQKIAYLVLAFAIMPGLSVSIGGILTEYVNWISCFYFLAAYGLLLLLLSAKLPETKKQLDLDAFKREHLVEGYVSQVKIPKLTTAGLIMGGCSSLVYLFASIAPFIAIEHFNMSSAAYGFANLLPSVGMIAGGLMSAQLLKKLSIIAVISIGAPLTCLGVAMLTAAMAFDWPPLWSLFIPTMITFAGNSMLYGNASTLGLQATADKAHGSAVMNFLNMGLCTLAVLSLSFITVNFTIALPFMNWIACFFIVTNFILIRKIGKNV